MQLDIDFVRSQYPVFQNPKTSQWAFFENAGGSYVPRQVIGRLIHFFNFTKVQPYGLFETSIEAGEAMNRAYNGISALLNVDEDELTLGPSTTMNFYILAQAIRPGLAAGDEIIVTEQDHEANIGCWERLAEFGAKIKWWQINPETGELDIDDLKKIITGHTRLVCFTLCSNIVGTMNDVAAIAAIAHDAGALAVGDGVSFAPHRVVDVDRLGLDLYLFSTYKTFGTHIGVMWGKRKVLESLKSQGHFFNADKPHYRMNPAGPLHAEIAALAGLVEYVDTLYAHHFTETAETRHQAAVRMFDVFAEHESRLANRVLDSLTDLRGVRIIGQTRAAPGKRAATIAFVPAGDKQAEIVQKLADRKVAVRNGHFYAYRCVKALGIEDPEAGVIRISLVHYNTDEEVDRLIQGLKEIINKEP